MSVVESQFPVNIGYQSRSGPSFNTSIARTQSGRETRNARWQLPLKRFNARYGIRSIADIQSVQRFYTARRGPHVGFRYKDFLDYSTDSTHTPDSSSPAFDDVVIATGDGETTEFQLLKLYTDGGVSVAWNIEKPVSGTVAVGLAGVEQSSGWSVNTVTGKVTFTTAPGDGVQITAGCDFDVPARFGEEIDLDGLLASIDGIESGSIPDIPIIELRNESPAQDLIFYGGTYEIADLTADTTVTPLNGRIVRVAECNGTAKIILGPAGDLQPGGPYFFFVNLDSTNSYEVRDEDDNLVVTVAAGETKTVVLAAQEASIPSVTWYTTDDDDHLAGFNFGQSGDVVDNGEKALSLTPVSSVEVNAGVLGTFGNKSMVFVAPASAPGFLEWQTGVWTLHLDLKSANATIETGFQAGRYSADGTTVVENQTQTTKVSTPTAQVYSLTSPSWSWSNSGSAAADDILVMAIQFFNNGSLGANPIVEVGGAADTRFDIPVVDQPTLFKWVGF